MPIQIHPRTGLTIQELRQRLDYDPTTGNFIWLVSVRGRAAHSAAGAFDGRYRYVKIHRRAYYAHILAWAFTHGSWPLFDLDHADEDKQNNAIWNIRPASRSQNSQNVTKTRGVSKYRGVSWHAASGKWQAGIVADGVKIFLGLHTIEANAAEAYIRAAAKYHTRNPFAKIKND